MPPCGDSRISMDACDHSIFRGAPKQSFFRTKRAASQDAGCCLWRECNVHQGYLLFPLPPPRKCCRSSYRWLFDLMERTRSVRTLMSCVVFVVVLVAGNTVSALEIAHYERSLQYRSVCTRQATCQEHNNLTCFGSQLPYISTTVELVDDAENQREVDERLTQLEAGLRKVPRCWQLAQPLLCSLYRPPCKNNSVHLISNTLCESARKACKIIMPQVGPQVGNVEWPYFLRCEQDVFFTKGCKNDATKSDIPKIRFNLSHECPTPLIHTTNRHSWYSEIDYCGISCTENPLISREEQTTKRWYDAWFVIVSVFCCLLTLLLYVPYSRSQNRLTYPDRLKFWFTVCLFIVCGGHCAQFLGLRELMLCNGDGTIRRDEPSPNWSLACLTNFVACYYFLNAAYVWFVIICGALNKSVLVVPLQNRSEADYWKSKFSYFHLSAWCFPLIMCVAVVVGPGIEADSIKGVCFVGRSSVLYRELLVSLPFLLALLIGALFLVHLTYKLHQRKYSSTTMLKEDSHKSIGKAMRRLQMFFLVMLGIGLITGFSLWYEATRYELWRTSTREHFACQLNVVQQPSDELNHAMETTSCELKDKPNLVILQIQLLVLPLACFTLLLATCKSSVAEACKHVFAKFVLRKKTQPPGKGFTQEIAALFAQEQDDEEEDHGPGDSVSQNLSSSYANMFSGMGYNVLSHQPVMIGRRYSSTSDVSHQTSNYMSSRALKRKTRKERNRQRVAEKTAVSKGENGDITVPFLPSQEQPSISQETQIRKRVLTQEDIVNSPFMHGMSGEARENRLYPYWRKPRPPGKLPPASKVPKLPLPPLIPPPIYSSLAGGLPRAAGPHPMQVPFAFPPQPCSLIDVYTGFPIAACPHYFAPYGIMPAPAPVNNDFMPFHDLDNIKSPIIPLRAHETGSETSYRVIVPSDTEYDTDAYRPQTAIPRNHARSKATGRSSAPFKMPGGFVSNWKTKLQAATEGP